MFVLLEEHGDACVLHGAHILGVYHTEEDAECALRILQEALPDTSSTFCVVPEEIGRDPDAEWLDDVLALARDA